jgi:hypothetical protein
MSAELFNNFLKTKYDNGKIPRQLFEEFPTLARVPKRSDGGGDYFTTAVITGRPQGLGATLALAQSGYTNANANQNVKGKKWIVPWGQYSASVMIEDFDIKRSRSNELAFINQLDEQVDELHRGFLEYMSILLFAEPGRYLAHGATAGTDTGVITLDNAADVVKFAVGQQLQISVNDGSDTSHVIVSGSAIGYVIAVNSNTGTVTVAATATGTTGGFPASWATTTSYYLFHSGDFGGDTAPATIFQGFGSWIPAADPGATAFNNVVRTVNVAALSGFRLTSAQVVGLSTRQRITKLITILNSRGTTPGVTDVILNPEKWQTFADELQAQGYRPLDGKGFTVNTSSIQVAIGGKMIDIVSDRHCPIGTCFALTMPKDGSNIVMSSVDEFPHVINEDGLMMVRQSTANTYEHRLQVYPAMAIKAPGWCGRVPV